MKATILLFALLALFAVVYADIWQNCGTPQDTLKIMSVTIVPNPPLIGMPISVNASGYLTKTITGGTIAITVFLNGIQIFSDSFDLCELSQNTDYKCPINTGPYSFALTTTVPGFAPQGEYKGKVIARDQSDAEIACISFDFVLKPPSVAMALDDEIIKAVNSDPTSTWVAGRNEKFEGMTLEEAKKFVGTRKALISKKIPRVSIHSGVSIPDSFDARDQWPNCVHPIRNQGQCGSCWAFGATEALSDRFCIASQGSINVVLSPQYMVSCDDSDYGCEGGYLDNAWEFLRTTGVCTEECFPYASSGGVAPPCITKCKDGSPIKLYKVSSVVTPYGVESIQNEIMNNGPVEGAFSVYQDFFSYKSGVYTHKSGALVGGHAIKIIGWGVQNNVPYWICANSWGTTWGMNGYFWIARGKDECGIEDDVIVGYPNLN